jgi:hypothetical protein
MDLPSWTRVAWLPNKVERSNAVRPLTRRRFPRQKRVWWRAAHEYRARSPTAPPAGVILRLGGPRPAVANSSAGFSASLAGIAWSAPQGAPAPVGYGQVLPSIPRILRLTTPLPSALGDLPLRIWAGPAGWDFLLFPGQARTSPLSKRFYQYCLASNEDLSGLSSAIRH